MISVALKERLLEPAKYPGCSGSRNVQDNISDLKAQVAANHKVSVVRIMKKGNYEEAYLFNVMPTGNFILQLYRPAVLC